MLAKLLLVGSGGFLGSVGRYLLGQAMLPHSSAFPFGTLLINVIGSFVIGALSVFTDGEGAAREYAKLFLSVGVCGGFTTFSTFSLETLRLFEKEVPLAFAYAAASVLLCLIGVFLGRLLVRALFPNA